MKKFIKFVKEIKVPSKKNLQVGYNAISIKEALLLFVSTVVAIISVVIILGKINQNFINEIPVSGGKITEGVIGMPTLINPVLAVSEADKDLTSLVYSGLLRKSTDGSLVPDLAESFEVSQDGTRYTFALKKDIKFHDGNPVTIEDVIFTINKIKDPAVKSPKKVQWEGVSIETTEDDKIIFVLKKPYASFLDNTTVGILPMHLWKNTNPAEFNLSPANVRAVGSGPYFIKSVERNSESIPEKYTLKRSKNFALGKPFIKEIVFKSYNNEKDLVQALKSGSIDQAGGISPENAKDLGSKNRSIETMVLPRMFGLFFNSNDNKTLGETSVRKAIDKALDRDQLIERVLLGYGIPINSPIPQSILDQTSISKDRESFSSETDEAYEILKKANWQKNEEGILVKKSSDKKTDSDILSFSITTGDAPELITAATEIQKQLEEFGMVIELRIYETGQLNQIIRDREYEVLFFGQVVNHGSDLFAFWHSSQKADPGLNIALFGNEKADIILNIAETILSSKERSQKYIQFEDIWRENMGSVFVYSPEYVYVTNKKLNMPKNYHFKNSQSRLENTYLWYINTDKVWKIFNK